MACRLQSICGYQLEQRGRCGQPQLWQSAMSRSQSADVQWHKQLRYVGVSLDLQSKSVGFSRGWLSSVKPSQWFWFNFSSMYQMWSRVHAELLGACCASESSLSRSGLQAVPQMMESALQCPGVESSQDMLHSILFRASPNRIQLFPFVFYNTHYPLVESSWVESEKVGRRAWVWNYVCKPMHFYSFRHWKRTLSRLRIDRRIQMKAAWSQRGRTVIPSSWLVRVSSITSISQILAYLNTHPHSSSPIARQHTIVGRHDWRCLETRKRRRWHTAKCNMIQFYQIFAIELRMTLTLAFRRSQCQMLIHH